MAKQPKNAKIAPKRAQGNLRSQPTNQQRQPWYESTMTWGAFSIAVAIILAVVTVDLRKEQLRWLLLLAFLFAAIAVFGVLRDIRRPNIRWLYICAALIVIAFGLYRIDRWRESSIQNVNEPPSNPRWSTLFTDYSGEAIQPTFSPDGNQVAFVWDSTHGKGRGLYVKAVPTETNPLPRQDTEPRYLAPNAYSPAWSPRSNRIAFLRDHGKQKTEVLMISLEEEELHPRILLEIEPPPDFLHGPDLAWTPDDNRIAVFGKIHGGARSALLIHSVKEGETYALMELPPDAIADDCPAFSPDGQSLSFVRYRSNSNGQLFVLPLSKDFKRQGEPRRLISFEYDAQVYGQVWRSNQEIIASVGPIGSAALRRILISETGASQQPTYVGENGKYPAFTYAARRLAYVREDANTELYQVTDLSQPGKNTTPALLVQSSRNDGNPQFCPSGEQIAFESSRLGSNRGVWICDSEGRSSPWQIADFESHVAGTPRWSPDGQWIVFDASPKGQSDIFIVSAKGDKTTLRQITKSPADDVAPSWSHDGNWIYFGSNRIPNGSNQSVQYQIWKIPADNADGEKQAVQVTRNGGFVALESPEGPTLYYSKGSYAPSLWKKTPVDGGEEKEVLDYLQNAFTFAPVGDGIYIIPRSDDILYIRFLGLSNGQVREVTRISDFTAGRGLAVFPDKSSPNQPRTILFTREIVKERSIRLVKDF